MSFILIRTGLKNGFMSFSLVSHDYYFIFNYKLKHIFIYLYIYIDCISFLTFIYLNFQFSKIGNVGAKRRQRGRRRRILMLVLGLISANNFYKCI